MKSKSIIVIFIVVLITIGAIVSSLRNKVTSSASELCMQSGFQYFNNAFTIAQFNGFIPQGYTTYNKQTGECVGDFIFKNTAAQIEQMVLISTSSANNSNILAVSVTPPDQAVTICGSVPGGCATEESLRNGVNQVFVCKDTKIQDCWQMLFGANQKIRYPATYSK